MAPKKRMEFGLNGYLTPVIPRAPRSIRKREPLNKSVEGNKLCAFELLATVAGQLLQESEGFTSDYVAEGKAHFGDGKIGNRKGQPKYDATLKLDNHDQHGSCAESVSFPEIPVQECDLFSNLKGLRRTEDGSAVAHYSVESSDSPKKVDCGLKLVMPEEKSLDTAITSVVERLNKKVEVKQQTLVENGKIKVVDLFTSNRSTVKDPSREFVDTDKPFSLESSVHFSLYRDPIRGALLRKRCNSVNLGIRDDDENSFGCNKFCTKIRSFLPHSCTERHRMRMMLKSKYRKVAPKVKHYELYSTRDRMRTFCRYRKASYARKICQRLPFKKRKLSDNSFAVAYKQDCSSDSIFPKKGARGDECDSAVILHGASGASVNMKGHKKVRFSITSFTVPELYIEVPETATIGSLKRNVMETVTSILRGGIRIGVVLQGKKVIDNNVTLQQACISQSCNLSNLGFTLEPNYACVSQSKNPEKPPLVLPCDSDQQSQRSASTLATDSCITHASDVRFVNKLGNVLVNNELMSSPKSPTDAPMDVTVANSKALVHVTPMNIEALPVATLNPKCSELSRRRIRRPFSVQEVEALVEAVEKLGTGRWRDIKMRAFENADHRTYVDLKDKWKTLVHTGSISPQQRRGEPVPQELLDRVLAAHSYWSQNQAKQGKQLIEPVKIIVADASV
ncbi:telomere binding protein [Dorcoceras hygrometricum]|uniref:Telomere binding protein n=1 Tax=Dorcoceras hygrometricum TaxID=472368 RepID=A0A2Z7DA30_9LAMI|nr:telomere binding protein [Dorcoceras hygrometricum]